MPEAVAEASGANEEIDAATGEGAPAKSAKSCRRIECQYTSVSLEVD
jgi:hypothetical protein